MEKKHDFLSGQVDAQRVAIVTLAVLLGKPQLFLSAFRDLSTYMREELLAHPISEQQLDGMRAETIAIEQLIQRGIT